MLLAFVAPLLEEPYQTFIQPAGAFSSCLWMNADEEFYSPMPGDVRVWCVARRCI
jgi:hypothetical protein